MIFLSKDNHHYHLVYSLPVFFISTDIYTNIDCIEDKYRLHQDFETGKNLWGNGRDCNVLQIICFEIRSLKTWLQQYGNKRNIHVIMLWTFTFHFGLIKSLWHSVLLESHDPVRKIKQAFLSPSSNCRWCSWVTEISTLHQVSSSIQTGQVSGSYTPPPTPSSPFTIVGHQCEK